MHLTAQITQALLKSPIAIRHLKVGSVVWMSIYFVSGIIIFSLFNWLLISNEETIKNTLLDYLFPKSWHELSEKWLLYFYEAQTKTVLGNMILGASLVIASIFLFPIKEAFSAKFEKDAKYPNGSVKEFPLWKQAWEETRLLLLYLTAQSIILWIGYYPYAWTKITSTSLSYLFLFFTFGLDFITPTLQRHRLEYPVILKALLKRPILVILFGLLYSLPIILLAKFMLSSETLSLVEITSILFLINMLFLTLAIPAGTHLASQLLPEIRRTQAPSSKAIGWNYAIMGILLFSTLYLHASLVKSLHHKSQLLKAEYSVNWNSFDYKLPGFSDFLNGKALTNLSFDLEIHNPTEFDIVIEQSQIHIDKLDTNIAVIELTGFAIPSGQTKRVNLKIDSLSDLGKITNFRTLLDDWRIDMHIKIWPGIPFILNIYEQNNQS